MGLQQRTALYILRMQRRIAESKSQRSPSQHRLRNAKHVRFSHIDSLKTGHNLTLNPQLRHVDQEESLRLIQRLRLALKPISEQESQASKDYESLQDELLRLSQHNARQKSSITEEQILEDFILPSSYGLSESAESLPYRVIRIVNPYEKLAEALSTSVPQRLERLDITPCDLSCYRQTSSASLSAQLAPNLTLVPAHAPDAPEAQDLLIDENVQLGDATAHLTQQSLQAQGPRTSQVSIRPEVALSLLDS